MHAQAMASAGLMTCVPATETGRVRIVLYVSSGVILSFETVPSPHPMHSSVQGLVPLGGLTSTLPKEILTHLFQSAATATLF